MRWGRESARAADAVCGSGNHRHDWDPHRVHVEPLVQRGQAGATLKATLVVSNPLARGRKLTIALEGRVRALEQTIRSVSLFEQVPDPAAGTAAARLARLTAELGIGALETCWRAVTGNPLPQAVRDYVDSTPHPGGA